VNSKPCAPPHPKAAVWGKKIPQNQLRDFLRVRELQGVQRLDPLIAKGNIIIEPP
jgi:hypothetical protein